MQINEDINWRYENQNKTYQGKYGDIKNSILMQNSRIFKEFFLLTYFLEEFKVLDKFNLNKTIDILEPGCGCGVLSRYFGIFSKNVYAFDNSEEGIKLSKKNNSGLENVHNFWGDGLKLDSIKKIESKKFDFIYLREFHPLSRNFFESSEKNMSVLNSYIELLKPNGILIVIHAQNKSSPCLNFEDIQKKYKKMFIGLYFPNFLIILLLIFRYKFSIASPIASFLSSILFIFLKRPVKLAVLQKRN